MGNMESNTEKSTLQGNSTKKGKNSYERQLSLKLGLVDLNPSMRTQQFISILKKELKSDGIELDIIAKDSEIPQNTILLCDFHSRPMEDIHGLEKYERKTDHKLMLLGICKVADAESIEEFISMNKNKYVNIDQFEVMTFQSGSWILIKTFENMRSLQSIREFAGINGKKTKLKHVCFVIVFGICCCYFCCR